MVNINPAYRTYELEYALKQSEVQTLILQGRFKTSDYVGMFYEACPEAYDCKAGRIKSEKFPFLKNVDLHRRYPLQRHVSLERRDPERRGDQQRRTGRTRGASLDFDDADQHPVHQRDHGLPEGGRPHPSQRPQQRLHHRRGDALLREGPALHPGAVLPLLRDGPLEHGLHDPRLDHGPARRRPSTPRTVLRTVQDERCTALHGVPTMFIAELGHPELPELLPRHAPDRDHGRVALPDRGDEGGQPRR